MRLLISILLFTSPMIYGQNKTATSLFVMADSTNYLTDIGSESGDLFEFLGHHGPAIENEWMGLRLYFNENVAIDVYSKSKLGLELREARWYPNQEQQKNGWGSDYYKAGSTVGLGGVRLWDGKKVIKLDPVSSRLARVVKTDSTSYMEMISKGVPYKGKKIDVLVRVTVFSGKREAKVEAMTVNGEMVQFATGINYHQGFETKKENNFIATWGEHPEDVAAELIEIGAAILYDPNDYSQNIDDGTQYLLLSKPLNYLETTILSASSKDRELNTLDKLVSYLKQFR